MNKSEDFVTNTTAASNYIPWRPRISINWNPTFQTSLHKISKVICFRLTKLLFRNNFFFKEQLLYSFLCIVKQKKISEWYEKFWKILIFKNHKVNWDPPWRISIHCDFDSLGDPLSHSHCAFSWADSSNIHRPSEWTWKQIIAFEKLMKKPPSNPATFEQERP